MFLIYKKLAKDGTSPNWSDSAEFFQTSSEGTNIIPTSVHLFRQKELNPTLCLVSHFRTSKFSEEMC